MKVFVVGCGNEMYDVVSVLVVVGVVVLGGVGLWCLVGGC